MRNHRWSQVLGLLLATGVLASTMALTPGSIAAPGVTPPDRVSEIVLVDSTEDVWQFFPGEDPGTKVGARPTVDITKARAAHRLHTVVARVRFVDLRRRPNPETVQVVIRTEDARFAGWVTMGPGNSGGTHRLLATPLSGGCRAPG